MSSNNYQIYINQTLQLAETIVIKSSYTADVLNTWVELGYSTVIDPDPSTWKYYLNLAGEYHFIDTPMTVVSLDTLETITFNKPNLVIHTATSRAYQYGSDNYKRLVQQYPDQEQLILGILYPVDIDAAVNAKDGQILLCPPGLIESQETSLVANLQKWVYHFKQRWHVPGFDYTEELYHATMLGIMYVLLVQAILTYRLRACNTNEAHSFHIKEYLAGHNHLDAYYGSMTLKQALYFYRNVAYIERHAGRNSTFAVLLEHIMTERSMPMGEYTMKHDVTQQIENIYPDVVFRKKQLNLGITLPIDNHISVAEMLGKEADVAPGNTQDVDDVTSAITDLMENSLSNVVATKVVESTMVDDTNSSPWILSEILFNHWLHFSHLGLYTAYINVVHPGTGETIPLTAKEAFVFALYVFAKSIGETLTEVPLFYASRVQRVPTASSDEIYAIVDQTIIPRDTAVTALSIQPVVKPMVSIDAFYNTASSINDAVQMQRRLIAQQNHYAGHAMVQAMVTRIYADYGVRLEDEGTLYANWLSARNIDLSTLTTDQFSALFTSVVDQATGASLHPQQSLAKLQQDMVQMFTKLSSYGIQVLAQINDAGDRKTDDPYAQVGSVNGSLEAHLYQPELGAEVLDWQGQLTIGVDVDLDHPKVGPDVVQYGSHRVSVDVSLNKDLVSTPTTYLYDLPLPNIGVTSPDPVGLVIPRGWISFVGIEYFLNLTPEQIGSIGDPYNPPGTYIPSTTVPLPQILTIAELDGLTMQDDGFH